MRTYFRLLLTLWVFSLSATEPVASAQHTSTVLTLEKQAKLTSLLSQDCDVDAETQWRVAIAEFAGPDAEKYAVQILARGAPEDQRAQVKKAATRRYQLRLERLSKDTGNLFDDQTAKRLKAVDMPTYVAAAMHSLDLIYRENALKALSVFGTERSIPAIEAAAEVTPSLQYLSDETISAIRKQKARDRTH